MNKKSVISNVIVSVIVNLLFAGILIGAGALVLAFPQIFGVVLSAAFALIGISLVLLFIISMLYLRYLKKHPEKNPNIFIFKVLGKIYDGLAVVIKAISNAFLWLITTLLWLITTAVKWLKFKFGKDKKKPKADNPDIDERTE